MDKSVEEEELEPLFDYSGVQPINVICLDDDCYDSALPKRRKVSHAAVIVEKGTKGTEIVNIVDEKEEEDWLPAPPKVSGAAPKFEEDLIIKELRLKKQELASFAQSGVDESRAVEELAKRDLKSSLHSSWETEVENASKPHDQRAKITISIQDKDGQKQFRFFKLTSWGFCFSSGFNANVKSQSRIMQTSSTIVQFLVDFSAFNWVDPCF